MAGTPLQYPIYAATLTITSTSQSLLVLLKALGGKYVNCPSSSRSYQLQPDPANTNNVFIGDENLATGGSQQCGLNMAAGSGFLDRAAVPYIGPFGSLWAKTSTGTALLNVMVFE